MVICQFGFCCAYFVFTGSNIFQVIEHYYPNTSFSTETVMAIILVPMIFYCMISNLKYLAPFCTIANILMMSSVLVILYSLFFDGDLKPLNQLELTAPVASWPKFFASALFAFEGIGCTIPIFYTMKEKSRFTKINGVLNISIFVVTVMYYVIGFVGYIKYGSNCENSITLNLPATRVIIRFHIYLNSLIIKVFYCFLGCLPISKSFLCSCRFFIV